MLPSLEASSQNRCRLFAATFTITSLLARLLHQFLMGRQALAQLLQPLAQLVAVPRLILDLVTELIAELVAFLFRAGRNLFLLITELLLVLLACLGHVLHGVFHFGGQALLQPRPILFECRTARLEAVTILLLHSLRPAATRPGSICALRHHDARRTGQGCHGYDQHFSFHSFQLS
jgi:hypothetical protein